MRRECRKACAVPPAAAPRLPRLTILVQLACLDLLGLQAVLQVTKDGQLVQDLIYVEGICMWCRTRAACGC